MSNLSQHVPCNSAIERFSAAVCLAVFARPASAQFGFSGGDDYSAELILVPWAVILLITAATALLPRRHRCVAASAAISAVKAYAALEGLVLLAAAAALAFTDEGSWSRTFFWQFSFLGIMFSGLLLIGAFSVMAVLHVCRERYRAMTKISGSESERVD